MTEQAEKATGFLRLHASERPLLLPNPWDKGSARLLASLGFQALATTSGGFAATLGRLDARPTRRIGYARGGTGARRRDRASNQPAGLRRPGERLCRRSRPRRRHPPPGAPGLAGCSVEDYTGVDEAPIYEIGLASERIAAAVEVAHSGPVHLVLTARAENHLRGRPDLADTIARLQAYEEAGADVLYAPGLRDPQDIRQLIASVKRPVNVLAVPGAPTVSELGALGVSRVSVGGAFAYAALGAVVQPQTSCSARGPTDSSSRPASASRRSAPRSRTEASIRREGAIPSSRSWRARPLAGGATVRFLRPMRRRPLIVAAHRAGRRLELSVARDASGALTLRA